MESCWYLPLNCMLFTWRRCNEKLVYLRVNYTQLEMGLIGDSVTTYGALYEYGPLRRRHTNYIRAKA